MIVDKDFIIKRNLELKKFVINHFIILLKFDSVLQCLNMEANLKANTLS